jgi:hypothetical protein
MPAKKMTEPKVTLESLRPTEVQWRNFREGRNARYWSAAMLSLHIYPTPENKTTLKNEHLAVYQECKNRLTILLKRRVSYPAIRAIATDNADLAPRNLFVSLQGVAKLASELGWDGSEEFVKLVSLPAKVTTLDGAHTLQVSDVEFSLQTKDMGRREALKNVRYAALVHLLRKAIDEPAEFDSLRKKLLGKRKVVSTQSLGVAVAQAVATLAKSSGKERIPFGFGKDKNADEIAFVEKFAKTNF